MDKAPEHCSRELSRSVRAFLEREIFPRLPIEPSLLSNSCQINPLFDLYRDQEANKVKVHHPDEWKCSYCSKVKDIQCRYTSSFAWKSCEALTSNSFALILTYSEVQEPVLHWSAYVEQTLRPFIGKLVMLLTPIAVYLSNCRFAVLHLAQSKIQRTIERPSV